LPKSLFKIQADYSIDDKAFPLLPGLSLSPKQIAKSTPRSTPEPQAKATRQH